MANTSVPPAVKAQLDILNEHINTLLKDRERIIGWFDEVGVNTSAWSLLSPASRSILQDLLTTEMQDAVIGLQSVVDVLRTF